MTDVLTPGQQKATALGWVQYYTCGACKGGKEYRYRHADHPGWQIRFKVKNDAAKTETFRLWLNNICVTNPQWSYLLEAKLKKYVTTS